MMEPTVERVEVTELDWGFTMNAYVVTDPNTRATAIVDPGADAGRILQLAGDDVIDIWITHADFDHVGDLAPVRDITGATVWAHALEVERIPGGADILLEHGDSFSLGDQPVHVFHIPGHAPGHLAFLVGQHLLSGDLLFPGGPGHTDSPEEFRELVAGIEAHLLTLDDATIVHPGHGEPTTIGAAREEYAAFCQRDDREGLYGDVTWRASST